LSDFLTSQGYDRGTSNKTLFIKKKNDDTILVQVYVDDIISGSNNEELCETFVKIMKSEFEMSMVGELNYFLGLQVKQLKDEIFLNQAKYCKDLLRKFGIEKCKSINTPFSTCCHLDQDIAGNPIDETKYRGRIRSLLYLTANKHDIMFTVYMCAHFQFAPKESHFNAAKRIMKYLQGTKEVSLWYPGNISLSLTGYSDSDFAGCKIDKKSIGGTCHLLGSSLISWQCKKAGLCCSFYC